MKRLLSKVRDYAHRGEYPLHCVYLGTVAIEAHGFYGMAAGALLVAVMVGAVAE